MKGEMLAIIFFAVLFGFFITKVNEKPRLLISDMLNAALDVIMKITLFIISFTPSGDIQYYCKGNCPANSDGERDK